MCLQSFVLASVCNNWKTYRQFRGQPANNVMPERGAEDCCLPRAPVARAHGGRNVNHAEGNTGRFRANSTKSGEMLANCSNLKNIGQILAFSWTARPISDDLGPILRQFGPTSANLGKARFGACDLLDPEFQRSKPRGLGKQVIGEHFSRRRPLAVSWSRVSPLE